MLVNDELLFQRCRPWFVQVCQLVVLVASFFSISPATRRHFHREPPADIVPICSSGCEEGYKEAADTTQRMQLMTEKWATRPLQGMHNIVVLDVFDLTISIAAGQAPCVLRRSSHPPLKPISRGCASEHFSAPVPGADCLLLPGGPRSVTPIQ